MTSGLFFWRCLLLWPHLDCFPLCPMPCVWPLPVKIFFMTWTLFCSCPVFVSTPQWLSHFIYSSWVSRLVYKWWLETLPQRVRLCILAQSSSSTSFSLFLFDVDADADASWRPARWRFVINFWVICRRREATRRRKVDKWVKPKLQRRKGQYAAGENKTPTMAGKKQTITRYGIFFKVAQKTDRRKKKHDILHLYTVNSCFCQLSFAHPVSKP